MGFLQSVILSALALAVIPLLIHLLFRRKSRVVPFSTLQFLKNLENKRIRNVKLQQILLLILRTLILVLLVLAFSRPVIQSGTGEAHERTSVILILDDSPSSGYQTRQGTTWDAIRKKASDILDLLRDGDEVAILSGSDPQEATDAWTSDPGRIRDRLREWPVGSGTAKFQDALITASRLMEKARHVNREIYVLSDMQTNGFAVQDDAAPWGKEIRTVFVAIGPGKADQASIRRASITSRLIEKGKPVDLEATFANAGSDREVLANVYVESRRVAQASLQLSENDEVTHVFRFTPDRAGYLRGYVEIDDDPLMSDNRRYFVLHVPEKIRILLIGERSTDTGILAMAMQPSPDVNAHFEIRRQIVAQAATVRLSDFDVVMMNGVARFSETMARHVDELLQAGGTLLVVPGTESDFQNYNRSLIGRYQAGQVTAIQRFPASFAEFGQIDYSHPLLSGLFTKPGEARIESPRFQSYYRLSAGSGRTVIGFGNGDPFLVEKKVHRGLLLLLTAALDPQTTDILQRSIFAPLIVRCVQYGYALSGSDDRDVELGGKTRMLFRHAFRDRPVLEDLDGLTYHPAVETMGVQSLLVFPRDLRPGALRILDHERPVGAVAANFPPDESVFVTAGPDEIRPLFKNFSFELASGEDHLRTYTLQSRVGFELWRWLLVSALILLAIEIMISQGHRIRSVFEKTTG